MLADEADYVIGVDTHRDQHTLAVVNAPAGAVVGGAQFRGFVDPGALMVAIDADGGEIDDFFQVWRGGDFFGARPSARHALQRWFAPSAACLSQARQTPRTWPHMSQHHPSRACCAPHFAQTAAGLS